MEMMGRLPGCVNRIIIKRYNNSSYSINRFCFLELRRADGISVFGRYMGFCHTFYPKMGLAFSAVSPFAC